MIAQENYSEDFLSDENFYHFKKLAEQIGCFIIGKNTYESVKKLKEIDFNELDCKKIVVSHTKINSKDFVVVHSPQDALQKATELGCTEVLLTGGGILNTAFMEEGLIDEIIVNINPFILGKGIRIFSEGNFENKLELVTFKKLKEGIVQVRYRVKKLL